MKNDNNLLKNLNNSLENLKGNLHIFETKVSVEKQMEYFRFTEAIRNDNLDEHFLEEQMNILTSNQSSPLDIKYALAILAISGDVKAYRAIESYNKTHFDDWSVMSLLQAQITLESELSDERQIFISSGLGGKGSKLRFFAFCISNEKKGFSDYQKKLIEKEIPFYIQKHQGILEEVKIYNDYFTLLFLINIQVDIKTMLDEAIDECNQYGNFINKGFFVTNVKIFSEEEIRNEWIR